MTLAEGWKLTKQEHVVHHLLVRQGLNADELQRLIWQENTRAEVHLCVIGLVLWHECLDMGISA